MIISLSPSLSKYKIKQFSSEKNKTIKKVKIKKGKFKFNNDIKNKNININHIQLSNKNFSITHYGAIIDNNSILRKKAIENFLPNYYSLPLLYNNNHKSIKKK